MKLKSIFTKFNVPVSFKDLGTSAGTFHHKSDIIFLDNNLKQSLPGCMKIVLLHEMIHATGSSKRLMRLQRLVDNFGTYSEGSLSYRLEECIAEIGCLVACLKLGLLNDYSKIVVVEGLKNNYTPDMYIPIREIRAAVKYFADDETSFEEEIEYIKVYLETTMNMKFQDTYNRKIA